jgi:hypothetical protein
MPVKKKYSKEFYAARPLALERAQNRCEDCGLENGTMRQDTGGRVRLGVHHLDHNPQNNDLDNLRALCEPCHGTYKKFAANANRAERLQTRAESGTNTDYKNVRKNKKLRQGGATTNQGEDGVLKIEVLRVFIAQNKHKLKKCGLYGGLTELCSRSALPQHANRAGRAGNKGESPVAGFTQIADIDLMRSRSAMSGDKEEKKRERERRKAEKRKREAERAAHAEKLDREYEARREAAEADSEEPPRKRKQGRPANDVHLPYHTLFRRDQPVVFYKADGLPYDKSGKLLSPEEERRLLEASSW